MTGTRAYQIASEQALERALFKTRTYATWRALDPGPGTPLDGRYAALPLTDKALIRAAFPDGLVPEGKDLNRGLASGEVEMVSTSGTTDERVTNLWNQAWWDFSERESWRLNAVTARICTGEQREAELTSARNVGFLSDERDLPFEDRLLGRLLFLNEKSSPVLWTRETIGRIVRELERHAPQLLEANPSYLARFAREAERMGLSVPQPGVILFTYENPSLLHLRQIRRVFRSPFVSSYGTTEAGYVLMECERGRHHLNAASCRVDAVPLDGADPGVVTLRVTPFGNEWVCLLRFDPGDIVRLDGGGPCACGRNGGMLVASIEGRAKSLTRSVEGRPVTHGELDRLLAEEASLVTYQLIQEGPRDFHLKAVLEERARKGAGDRLHDALRDLYGGAAHVRVEICSEVAPEPSGKFLLAKGYASPEGAAP